MRKATAAIKLVLVWAFGNWLWGVISPGVGVVAAGLIGWASHVSTPWVYLIAAGAFLIVSPAFALGGRRLVVALRPPAKKLDASSSAGLPGLLARNMTEEETFQHKVTEQQIRTERDTELHPRSYHDPGSRRDTPTPLSSLERDELRKIIAEGEALLPEPTNAETVRSWAEHAASWLEKHGQRYHARHFRRWQADSDVDVREAHDRRLVELRVALAQNIPPGFDLDLTFAEAFERWMEVENIPEEQRSMLRERNAHYIKELERE